MIRSAPPRVAVIGAGVAGLAAARALAGAGCQVTVLERDARVGGRVSTDVVEGFAIDTGAQFLTSFYTNTLALIRELDLANEIVKVPGSAATLRAGRIYPLWPDARLAFTRLVSLRSKLRLAGTLGQLLSHWSELDFHAIDKAHRLDTISLAEYAHQNLDDDLLEYVIQPPLSSLLYWTPEHTSQAMLFLLLKAGLGINIFTLRRGLRQLPDAMAAGLSVSCCTEVSRVTAELSGELSGEPSGEYRVQARVEGREAFFPADGIVCACPATAVGALFPGLSEPQRAFFASVGYAANAITALAVGRRLPPAIYGLFFPRREAKHLASAAIQSVRNPAQVPAGKDLIVLAPSGPGGQALYDQDDATIRDTLRAELKLAGAAYDPGPDELWHRVYRWPQAIPRFDVGHLRRLNAFSEGQIETGRVAFAGDYLGGPFVEGAITSGLSAARRLLARLKP